MAKEYSVEIDTSKEALRTDACVLTLGECPAIRLEKDGLGHAGPAPLCGSNPNLQSIYVWRNPDRALVYPSRK